MSEILERFSDLDKKEMSEFKRNYNGAQTALLKASEYAYKLKEKNEIQFTDFALNVVQISKSTLSKMLLAGKLLIEKPETITLPKSYNAVYEITKVSDQLIDFDNFVKTEKSITLDKLTVRQAHIFTDDFIKRQESSEEESSEEESSEEESSEKESSEEESDEVIDIFNNLHTLAVYVKEYLYDKNTDNAIEYINIILDILDRKI